MWFSRCLKLADLLDWCEILEYPSQTAIYLFHSEVKLVGSVDIQLKIMLILASLSRVVFIHSTNIDYLHYGGALMI